MRTAQEVIEAIHAARYTGDKVGPMNTQLLLDEMNLTLSVPVIHVAGTNGKGSVCAMLESILRHSGRKTGLYTSPFLQAYNERTRLNGKPVFDELLAKYGTRVLDAAARLNERGIRPTTFTLGTALAFLIFEMEQVDAVVCEVGMGGRMDPTNIVRPAVSVITAIGMDHMQYLGDTIEQIAGEKAGIIKESVPVVVHPAEDAVAEVFRKAAEGLHAPLTQLTAEQITNAMCGERSSTADFHLSEDWPGVRIPLPGGHQLTNTLTVLGAVEALDKQGMTLPRDKVYAGIAATHWPARLEWCGNILLDGAHNPQGVHALQAYAAAHLTLRRKVLLTGVLEDHLNPEMLDALCGLSDTIVTVTPDSPRAMDGAALAKLFAEKGKDVTACAALDAALDRAKTQAGEDGVVLVAGSLYLAGAVRTLLGMPWD